MTTEQAGRASGRRQFLLIAAVFTVPLILAAWMYYFDNSLAPESATNKGDLLLPITNLNDELGQSDILNTDISQWLMVYPNTANCDRTCDDALLRLRQSRLMLGKDMRRIERVFLHGDSAPDTVALEQQHPGLITMYDKDLSLLLQGKRPTESLPGGIFLIDPLGNLVMYFPPNLDPKEMVGDIKHLLKLSHIG